MCKVLRTGGPGARMLVTGEGELTGAISGGCLEGDALRKALFVMTEGRAMLVTYDTNDEDDAKFGMGLGCNGIIQVLIEPIDAGKKDNPIALLKAITAKRQQAALVTLFSLDKKAYQPGTCILVMSDENMMGAETGLHDILINEAKQVLKLQQSSFINYISERQNLTAFVEWIRPSVSLVIAGAGNDVVSVGGNGGNAGLGNHACRWSARLCKKGKIFRIMPGFFGPAGRSFAETKD